MKLTVLIADDDAVFRELIRDIVLQQGYDVIEAGDGLEAIELFFSSRRIDLVILDVMMPKCDGWEALQEIRTHSDVPVLMLTALGDEKNEILGLSHGADDYITKPFSYAVFIARINALLRKTKKEQNMLITFGKLKIDRHGQHVFIEDVETVLSSKEYQLLLYFILSKGMVLTRDMILCRLWGYDFDGDSRTVDTHVKTLRQKLNECGTYIETVRGFGYRFRVQE